jgi:hypothetical protein
MKDNERRITLFDHSDKEQVVITARYLAAEAGFDETNQQNMQKKAKLY